MVQVVTITKAQMLEKYARRGIIDPVNVNNVESKNWIYACTTEGQANNPEGYIVLRCEN